MKFFPQRLRQSVFLLLIVPFSIFILGCQEEEEESKTPATTTPTITKTLSQTVVAELGTHLKASSAKLRNVSSIGNSPLFAAASINLTSTQVSNITTKTLTEIANANLTDSEDLIGIMPVIVKGAQKSLSDIGITDETQKINIIKVIAKSIVTSINGRDSNLPEASKEGSLSAKQTVLKKIVDSAISNLDKAGISTAKLATASGSVVGTLVSTLDEGGVASNELSGAIKTITAGATGALDNTGVQTTDMKNIVNQISSGATGAIGNTGAPKSDMMGLVKQVTAGTTSALGDIPGIQASDIKGMLKEITAGATGALDDISILGAADMAGMVKEVTAGATGALDDISGVQTSDMASMLKEITAGATSALDDVSGIQTSDMTNMLKEITAGATGALDEITGIASTDIGSMVKEITSGATGALDEISSISASDLGGMVKQVTAGTTGALDDIAMSGYDATILSAMAKEITAGATGALDDISMSGYDADDLGGMMKEITAGATGALDDIAMNGYSASELGAMTKEITAGATGALDDIVMTGYDVTKLGAMTKEITAGATGALDDIVMTGYDATKLGAMTKEITAGATGALDDIVMTGYTSNNLGAMMKEITAGATGALGDISMTNYDSNDLGAMMKEITAGATGALDEITMTNYDSNDLGAMMKEITAGATGALDEITMTNYDSNDLGAMMKEITAGATGALDDIKGMVGYDSSDLGNMMKEITAGATGALDDIVMDGYSATELGAMTKEITAGATGALDEIRMTGYSSTDLSAMVQSITKGATGALGDISMTDYDSSDLSGVVQQISSGATGALDEITMSGYDDTDIAGMKTSITNGATSGLGEMDTSDWTDFDVNTLTGDISTGIDSADDELSVQVPSDITAPTVGNSGTISSSDISDTSLTLTWTVAIDETSDATTLEYIVYRSDSDNITSEDNMAMNGTEVTFGININSVNVTGLTASTTYYFNVIVFDEIWNSAVYTTVSATTTATPDGNTGTTVTLPDDGLLFNVYYDGDYGYSKLDTNTLQMTSFTLDLETEDGETQNTDSGASGSFEQITSAVITDLGGTTASLMLNGQLSVAFSTGAQSYVTEGPNPGVDVTLYNSIAANDINVHVRFRELQNQVVGSIRPLEVSSGNYVQALDMIRLSSGSWVSARKAISDITNVSDVELIGSYTYTMDVANKKLDMNTGNLWSVKNIKTFDLSGSVTISTLMEQNYLDRLTSADRVFVENNSVTFSNGAKKIMFNSVTPYTATNLDSVTPTDSDTNSYGATDLAGIIQNTKYDSSGTSTRYVGALKNDINGKRYAIVFVPTNDTDVLAGGSLTAVLEISNGSLNYNEQIESVGTYRPVTVNGGIDAIVIEGDDIEDKVFYYEVTGENKVHAANFYLQAGEYTSSSTVFNQQALQDIKNALTISTSSSSVGILQDQMVGYIRPLESESTYVKAFGLNKFIGGSWTCGRVAFTDITTTVGDAVLSDNCGNYTIDSSTDRLNGSSHGIKDLSRTNLSSVTLQISSLMEQEHYDRLSDTDKADADGNVTFSSGAEKYSFNIFWTYEQTDLSNVTSDDSDSHTCGASDLAGVINATTYNSSVTGISTNTCYLGALKNDINGKRYAILFVPSGGDVRTGSLTAVLEASNGQLNFDDKIENIGIYSPVTVNNTIQAIKILGASTDAGAQLQSKVLYYWEDPNSTDRVHVADFHDTAGEGSQPSVYFNQQALQDIKDAF